MQCKKVQGLWPRIHIPVEKGKNGREQERKDDLLREEKIERKVSLLKGGRWNYNIWKNMCLLKEERKEQRKGAITMKEVMRLLREERNEQRKGEITMKEKLSLQEEKKTKE